MWTSDTLKMCNTYTNNKIKLKICYINEMG